MTARAIILELLALARIEASRGRKDWADFYAAKALRMDPQCRYLTA